MSGPSSGGVGRENPHLPRPREAVLPNGDLAVVGDRQLSNKAVTVPATDRPLYELQMDILEDSKIPDTMPANIAVACDNLVEAHEAVSNPERGSACINGPGYGLSYLNRVREAIKEHRDREPLTLVAVGCSGSKYEDPGDLPAKERYKGAYWTNKRRYGETIGDDWRIISGEFAVLAPDTGIEYYERTPDDLRGVPIDSEERLPNGDDVATLLDRWGLDVHDQLAHWIQSAAGGVDPRDVELEVLLGRRYRGPLEDRGVFEALRGPASLTVSFPFQEHDFDGNGEQMGWMSDEVEAAAAVATDGGELQ